MLMLFSMLHYERINMTMSLSFLGLYTLYVVTVFFQDRMYDSAKGSESALKAKRLVEMTELMEIKSYSDSSQKANTNASNAYDFESEFNTQQSAQIYKSETNEQGAGKSASIFDNLCEDYFGEATDPLQAI